MTRRSHRFAVPMPASLLRGLSVKPNSVTTPRLRPNQLLEGYFDGIEIEPASAAEEPLRESSDRQNNSLLIETKKLAHRNAHSPGEPSATKGSISLPVRFCQRS